jgi:hypothetical protein
VSAGARCVRIETLLQASPRLARQHPAHVAAQRWVKCKLCAPLLPRERVLRAIGQGNRIER